MIDLERLKEAACKCFGVTINELNGRHRQANIIYAKVAIAKVLKDNGLDNEAIALKMFGIIYFSLAYFK